MEARAGAHYWARESGRPRGHGDVDGAKVGEAVRQESAERHGVETNLPWPGGIVRDAESLPEPRIVFAAIEQLRVHPERLERLWRGQLRGQLRGQIVGSEGPVRNHGPLHLPLEPLGGVASNPCVSRRQVNGVVWRHFSVLAWALERSAYEDARARQRRRNGGRWRNAKPPAGNVTGLPPRTLRQHEEVAKAGDEHAGHSCEKECSDLKPAGIVSAAQAAVSRPGAQRQTGDAGDTPCPKQQAFHLRPHWLRFRRRRLGGRRASLRPMVTRPPVECHEEVGPVLLIGSSPGSGIPVGWLRAAEVWAWHPPHPAPGAWRDPSAAWSGSPRGA